MNMISAIVAVAKNGVIGNSGELPWYLPADLKHFKEVTLGHPVIMGRTTYESIFDRLGHPLPGRHNIVISRDEAYEALDTTVVHSLDEAILAAESSDMFIIGGAQIYALAAETIDRWYVTEIDTDIEGDVLLEGFNKDAFIEVTREDHVPDEKNPYTYSFVTYDKR